MISKQQILQQSSCGKLVAMLILMKRKLTSQMDAISYARFWTKERLDMLDHCPDDETRNKVIEAFRISQVEVYHG